MIYKNIKYKLYYLFEFIFKAFSLNEFKRFSNDNHGGLVLTFDNINLPDKEWVEYKLLKTDNSVKSISPNDLPSDFCPKARRLVDEFHKKTVNENVEWMLYFDYTTGEVIYCWKGNEDYTGGSYDKISFHGRNMASIHNHSKNYYSFPSPDNFDILENEFEDYEIITSVNTFWSVEFKGFVEKEVRQNFQYNIAKYMNRINNKIISKYVDNDSINYLLEFYIGDYLLNFIDKKINNIDLILIKKEV